MFECGKVAAIDQELEMGAQEARLEGQLWAAVQKDAMTWTLAKKGETGQELLQPSRRNNEQHVKAHRMPNKYCKTNFNQWKGKYGFIFNGTSRLGMFIKAMLSSEYSKTGIVKTAS